jgi:LacI family transcriptional regulator, repressor for deo operon, udp, cdd, tsx, nupC, and nupG
MNDPGTERLFSKNGRVRASTRRASLPAGGGPASPTIHDVAREAGVAASTVSRALSVPGRGSAETRQRILSVAQRLGYRPNPLARALPSGRTATIALIVPDITNPFFFGVIRGAERQGRRRGFATVLADSEESTELEALHIEHLDRAVDGFVLVSSRLPDQDLRQLTKSIALTLVNRVVPGVPHVFIDNRDAVRQAVEHLASLGHLSIIYLAGPRASWSDRQRWLALRRSAEKCGIGIRRLGPFSPEIGGGTAAADASIALGATAVVAFNDLLAIGVLHRLLELGLTVPGDMSVVGFDDIGKITGTEFTSPPLTTVAAPVEEAGRAAVNLLLSHMGEDGAEQAVKEVGLPSELHIRGSTGTPRAARVTGGVSPRRAAKLHRVRSRQS